MKNEKHPVSSPRTNATVLLVEDERPLRALVRRILEEEGYQVLEAVNGEEGINLLAGDAVVDLLIADLDRRAHV